MDQSRSTVKCPLLPSASGGPVYCIGVEGEGESESEGAEAVWKLIFPKNGVAESARSQIGVMTS